ncbi:HAD superfamily hydrolase (TIGR01509 family)/HAD superfamily hydrolase (TIGR01549 family) [Neolewinella xylanilytica]|uniref:phosphoglycolate phosphatase n=1 Tax=Neolewinella xylanilytica TaxID=1514080 RepID=A0A2S6I9L5_9BACT|nr:SemiSWEET transporter [Neolewinella xylanilytica]PPK88183.1 HAD superfamily hydrolase (TIGR01509 family)/HAD superfamily hydrolase (TIGR01549 family) [Neolewinella xylanilytica]
MSPFLLGLAAATLTTSAYVPQVLHSWRSKSTRDLSLPMLVLFCSGVFLWLLYGLWIGDVPVVVANGLTLILALSLLTLKLTNYGDRPAQANTPSPALTAVLFDLDGTLANTLPLCIEAFRLAVEPSAGRSLTDREIMATFGPSEEGTIQALAPDRYEQGLADYLAHYERLHDRYPVPFDGMVTLLHYLRYRGVRLGLVTGKGVESTRLSLRQFGLEAFFEVMETGSPRGPRKAEALRHILSEWNLQPAEAVYVGDAPGDVTAARKLGIPVVAAAWSATADGAALSALQPDAVVHSVDALFAWLEPRLASGVAVGLPA